MFQHNQEEPGDIICYKYDLIETKGNVDTEKEIQTMLYTKDIDTEQEYQCTFTTAQGSTFGTGTEAEKQGLRDLLLDDEEEENDNQEMPLENITDEQICENQNYSR